MRTKKFYSFDEEKDAEELLKKGFPNGIIDYSQMYVLAKYFRYKFGYGEVRLEKALTKFCKEQDANFNPITEAEAIHKWIRNAMTYNLRKIESVSITSKEIEFLNTISSSKDRKILFMVLIMAKALHNSSKHVNRDPEKPIKYYIHYTNLPDVIHMTGFKNLSEFQLCKILGEYKSNLLFYSAEKELIRVDFADSAQNSLTKVDLQNVLEEYDLLFKKINSAVICEKCKKPFFKTNNSQKYCSECKKIVRKEQTRFYMEKKRKGL